jgi:uncharacterized protein
VHALPVSDPLAISVTDAIRQGDVATLRQLLHDHPGLATTGIVSTGEAAGTRSLLHVATDWPGSFPNASSTIAALLAAGADPDARFEGVHRERPLHWAASCDDVPAIDALLEGGADIEAPGAVIGGGTALADAVAFGQWRAARRLVERGAAATLWQAAALGLIDRVQGFLLPPAAAAADEITNAFWCACHGGQREAAALLLDSGADLNWVGYDGLTPLDAAERSGAMDLVEWLRGRGATRGSRRA